MSQVSQAVLDKIHKLLELSNISKNSSESEAYAALLKAQELMVKYHIDLADIESPKESIDRVICDHKYNYKFRHKLAHIVARNFRVKPFISNNSSAFYGYHSDVEAAKQVFEFAYKLIVRNGEKHRNQCYRDGFSASGVFNSYAIGFLDGMEQAFDAQCELLQITTPKEVCDGFDTMTEGWNMRSASLNLDRLDGEYHKLGIQDAKNTFGQKNLEPTASY